MSDEASKNEIDNANSTSNSGEVTPETRPEKEEPGLDSELVESFEDLPPELKSFIMASRSASSLEITSGTKRSSLIEKFNDEHIHKYLDYIQRDDDNTFELQKTNRYFQLVYVIIAVVAFALGVVFLVDRDRDLLVSLIQFLIILAGGIGTGYGLKSRKD